jgi:uncharacterized protein DUF6883
MTLPNAHLAVVDQRKVVDYLLNAAHPDNGGKAKFFEALGYSGANPSSLVGALKNIAVAGKVVERSESVHGEKYVVDGMLMSHTEQSRFRARSHRLDCRTLDGRAASCDGIPSRG